jgi:type IV pilus assembly protein PilA
MAVDWFYADAQNQQQGPVPGSRLAELFRSGAVQQETLVWRDGLAGWVPLRSVAAQLGLIIVGNAPPPLAAGQRPPGGAVRSPQGAIVKPTGGGGAGTAVIVAVVVFVVIAFMGILAAIALPAYQQYTIRSKVTMVLVQADSVKVSVSEFHANENRCPKSEDKGFASKDFSFKYVSGVEIGPLKESGRCAVRLTVTGLGGSDTEGKRVLFSLGDGDDWQTSTDLPQKYLPMSLRQH